jgi:hypothetical protein
MSEHYVLTFMSGASEARVVWGLLMLAGCLVLW